MRRSDRVAVLPLFDPQQLFAENPNPAGHLFVGLFQSARDERDDSQEQQHLSCGGDQPGGGRVERSVSESVPDDQCSSGGQSENSDVGQQLAPERGRMGNGTGGCTRGKRREVVIGLPGGRCVGRGRLGVVCLLYTSPSPRDKRQSRMPSSA